MTAGPTTLTLADFLRARLDEDEAAARAGLDYLAHQHATWTEAVNYLCRPGVGLLLGAYLDQQDPARVLADVEAKRAALDLSDAIDSEVEAMRVLSRSDPARALIDGRRAAVDVVLRLLAQPYRDHPDWRPEWSA
jgi:hypothetical protein